MNRTKYENPLVDRYAGKEMSRIWSPQAKFTTWRRLWIALAEAEKELGLDITDEQIAQMKANIDNIDFDLAAAKEKELRHDVQSHIHTFGEACPLARPIIHLGATSCYITDNTELIQMKDSAQLIRRQLLGLIAALRAFAHKHKDLPTLGFTHYQPAQLTTVGKRAALWLHDSLIDFTHLQRLIDDLPFRGAKGTTGTQASFLALFDGDHEKVKQLDRMVTRRMGFQRTVPVSGQTYSRKYDFIVVSTLSGIAQSAHKMAGDIRLLMNLREMDEPFEENQVGSSAMAYKRNPMRSERICALARYLISLPANTANTHANQWLERTLDDSANRRLVLPEAFLTAGVILNLAINVTDGLRVWPLVIRRRIEAELPFMATENIMMAGVKAGGDRQILHEAIRKHSLATARQMKEEGSDNDLLTRIAADPLFADFRHQWDAVVDPADYVGRAPAQVEEFIAEEIDPLLDRYADLIAGPLDNPAV